MIILKIVGIFLVAVFCLYLLVGLALISHELFLGLIIFLSAPLRGPKQIPDEYQTYVAPVGEQSKEIPGCILDLVKYLTWWLGLPFKICWAFATNKKSEEQAAP
jgi:hypothetical protein